MWKDTEEISSDERAQFKKNKIANHVTICGTDAGDVLRRILTGSALSSNRCLAPKNAVLEHGSRCASESPRFKKKKWLLFV